MLLRKLKIVVKINIFWLRLNIKRFLISSSNYLILEETFAVIDFPEPHSLLLFLLFTTNPDTQVNIELVIWKEHPSELANKFDWVYHEVDFIICEKVW